MPLEPNAKIFGNLSVNFSNARIAAVNAVHILSGKNGFKRCRHLLV